WKDERNKIPITYWKKMAHVLGKPVPLDNKNKDELPIIKIKKDYVSIEEKKVLMKCYRQLRREVQGELSVGMETLECLVDDLNKELGIPEDLEGVSELEKEQQIQVEELLEMNKDLSVDRLT
ncbi:4567_t:CDS:2, partial [Dentiscutata heterogama]